MTMNKIDVLIYSYKGKNLKETVENLIINKSQSSYINIAVIDQHPLDRSETFRNMPNVYYQHVFWDWLTNQCQQKYSFLNRSKSDYILFLEDNVLLEKNWDITLVDFVEKNNCVVSGQSKISLEFENIFYLKKVYSDSDTFALNNYVDRALIFAKRDHLKIVKYPVYLKYNGEEEHLSLSWFVRGIDIYGMPTGSYKVVAENSIKNLYVPFSKNHNYNEVVDLLEYGKNRYFSALEQTRTLEDFIDFQNINLKQLKKLPYPSNDVLYDPESLKMNKIDARRFIDRTREIS